MNKKAQIGSIIIIIVSLFVSILGYVYVVPVMMEFTGGESGFLGFLFKGLPAFLFLGIVVGTVRYG